VENFRNTELGFLRIRKNLKIEDYSDLATENYLRGILLSTPLDNIEKKGKNYYFTATEYNAILTVNSHSLTIITAKQIDLV
jgi:hypothetical protein